MQKFLRNITAMAAAFVMWSLTQPANAITTSACNAIADSTINDGICYVVADNIDTWVNHEAAANTLGLNLVSIHTQAQNDFVAGIGVEFFSFWIGLNDLASEGTFVWSDGSPFDFVNWIPGEPNNSGEEDVTELVPINPFCFPPFSCDGQWNDHKTRIEEEAVYSGPIEPEEVDHYRCYEVAEVTELDPSPIVDLTDQFFIEEDIVVKKAMMICPPVDKNGGGVMHPDTHLVCYETEPESEEAKLEVEIATQFGVQILEVKKSKLLCVPSVKDIIGPIGNDDDGKDG